MPFCPNCGTDVSDSTFCSSCGTPTAGPASGGAAPPPAPEAAPGSGGAPAEQDSQPSGQPGAQQTFPSPGAGPESVSGSTRNIASALAYITPVAVILLLIEPFKSIRLIRFHSLQSLFYFAGWIVLQFVLGFIAPPIGFLVTIGFVIGSFFIAYKAFLGEMFDLPVLGELVRKYL
jgi:uncharacterized membrane protein